MSDDDDHRGGVTRSQRKRFYFPHCGMVGEKQRWIRWLDRARGETKWQRLVRGERESRTGNLRDATSAAMLTYSTVSLQRSAKSFKVGISNFF
jgi:hypothetical protein